MSKTPLTPNSAASAASFQVQAASGFDGGFPTPATGDQAPSCASSQASSYGDVATPDFDFSSHNTPHFPPHAMMSPQFPMAEADHYHQASLMMTDPTFAAFSMPTASTQESAFQQQQQPQQLPRGTVHTPLFGNVSFIPYPQTVGDVQQFLHVCSQRRELGIVHGLVNPQRNVRAFIGQLPYAVTEMQLLWICNYFGGDIVHPQRITKTKPDGERVPTGGVHVMCDEASFARLLTMMHKRVLIDDTGLWFAATPEQKCNLDSYVRFLHENRNARKPGRPYETVVIQHAESTFVPRKAMNFDSTRR